MTRASWLTRPWFFAALGVLLLNDHVLKSAWPGWVTGKLSDFAGLVIVATLLCIVSGPTAGTVLAGVAFVALKTVPGVAEAASPLLGGTTLRDATDLIAILVLPLVWRELTSQRPNQERHTRKGWQALALVLAVLAITATSKFDPPTDDYLSGLGWSRDGYFYVRVEAIDDKDLHYMRSGDGGATWTTSPPPDRLYSSGYGEDTVCADDGVCYRSSRRDLNTLPDEYAYLTLMERRLPGKGWLTETVFGDRDYLPGTLAVNLTNSHQVIAMSSDGRILQRAGYGDYRAVNVRDYFRGRR